MTRLTLRSLLQTTDYVQGGVLNFLMTCQSKTIKFFNVLLRFHMFTIWGNFMSRDFIPFLLEVWGYSKFVDSSTANRHNKENSNLKWIVSNDLFTWICPLICKPVLSSLKIKSFYQTKKNIVTRSDDLMLQCSLQEVPTLVHIV